MTACDGPAIDPSQSLVGAKQLPSADVLSREIIQISRGFGSPTSPLLTYELEPDDTLTVTLTHRDRTTFAEVTDGKETFHLSSKIASGARRNLWRLRPEPLEGIEQVTRPADCPPPPTDTIAEAAVAFMPGRPKPGVAHVDLGVTEVPSAHTCATRQGVEARNVVTSVLKSFPPSTGAAEYDRRRNEVLGPL